MCLEWIREDAEIFKKQLHHGDVETVKKQQHRSSSGYRSAAATVEVEFSGATWDEPAGL